MGRRTLLLITSILLAAVGTALIALYVKGADSRAQQGQALVSVWVVKNKVPAQTPVSQISFTPVDRHRSDLPSAPITNLKSISGQVAATTLLPGQVLQTAMFAASVAAATSSVGIAPNDFGASFQLTDPQRVASLLEPGMKVAVFQVPDKGPSRLLLPDVKVIKVGDAGTATSSDSGNTGSTGTSNGSTTDQVASTIITFDLSKTQMTKMLDAQRDGQLALGVEATSSTGSAS